MDNDFDNLDSNIEKEIANRTNQVGKGAKKTAKGVRNTARRFRRNSKKTRKLAKKTGKAAVKVGKALAKVILSTLKALLIAFSGPILVLSLAVLSYFIIFEFVGTEKQYSGAYENEVEKEEDGIYYVKDRIMNSQNQLISDYYTYMTGQSYFKSLGSDKNIYSPEEPEVIDVVDYYNREDTFALEKNLLYSLDEHLYDWKYKYSEQFIQPVAYDEETFDLLPLTDEDGYVVVESNKQDLETGEKLDEVKNSVCDYGLASILKYNEKEDYVKTEKMIGKYVAIDVWNPKTKRKEKVELPEPVDFEIEVSKEDIYLIDKATVFNGNIEYEYEYEDKYLHQLQGAGKVETDIADRYIYDVYHEKECKYETKIDEEGNETRELVCKTIATHDLYKYRSSDSALYESVPEVSNTKITNDDLDYFKSYLRNFEAYVPKDVLQAFIFDSRVDYSSKVFDYEGFLVDGYGFNIGSKKNSAKANYAMQWFEQVKRHSADFGVDPYIIIAMMTQESGGKNINGDGIMQLWAPGNGTRKQTAVNVKGERETLVITQSEKTSNPDKAIRFGVMFYKNLLDTFDGNNFKAIQAYNFGAGGLKRIEKYDKEAWNSDYGWLIYRERARRENAAAEGYAGRPSANYSCMPFPEGILPDTGKYYGNSCHLEMVLQYYAGDVIDSSGRIGQDKLEDEDYGEDEGEEKDEDDEEESESFFTRVGNIFDFLIQRNEDEPIPKVEHRNYLSEGRIKDVINTTIALNEEFLFSVAAGDSGATINSWEDGFLKSVSTQGINLAHLMTLIPNADGFTTPIDLSKGRISSRFGPRIHPIKGVKKVHEGVDVAAPTGTPVYAVADGKILQAHYSSSAGNMIHVDHGDGVVTVYMHLSSLGVSAGDLVSQGDEIGKVGNTGNSTGPHLHFELRKNGVPLDPESILAGSKDSQLAKEQLS